MGQHYKIVNLDKKKVIKPSGFLKLMEWNWVGNKTVSILLKLLKKEWLGDRVVIVGDYYNEDDDDYFGFNKEDFKTKEEDKEYYRGLYDVDEIFGWNEANIKEHLFELETEGPVETGYLINETRKLFCDIAKIPQNDGWRVSATVLLACGNGRGGGDYRSENPDSEKIGDWAGEKISFSIKRPSDKYIEKQYYFEEK